MKEKIEIRSLPISMTTNEDGSLTVSGLVNGAGSVSEVLTNPGNGKKFRETISPGVFSNAIKNADRIDFLSQHDKSMILSTTDNNSLSLQETTKGLEMRANIAPTSWGNDTYQLIKNGIIKGMSFGMRVLKDSWSTSPDGIPMRTIDGVKLVEVSAVRNPAYKDSGIEARDMDIINDVNIPNTEEEEKRDLTEEEKKQQAEKEAADKKSEEKEVEDKKPEKEEKSDKEEKSEKEVSADKEDPKKEESRSKEEVIPAEEVRALISELKDELKSEIAEVKTQVTGIASEVRSAEDEKEKEKTEVRSRETKVRTYFND